MIYGIAYHNYKDKKTKIIEWHGEKYNALQKMEEYAYKYIYDNEGYKVIKVYEEGGHERPYGYFIERSPNKNLCSLKVRFKKWQRGYVYGNVDFEDICLFSLIMSNKKKKEVINTSHEVIDDHVKSDYNNVLKELEETFDKDNVLPFNLETSNSSED